MSGVSEAYGLYLQSLPIDAAEWRRLGVASAIVVLRREAAARSRDVTGAECDNVLREHGLDSDAAIAARLTARCDVPSDAKCEAVRDAVLAGYAETIRAGRLVRDSDARVAASDAAIDVVERECAGTRRGEVILAALRGTRCPGYGADGFPTMSDVAGLLREDAERSALSPGLLAVRAMAILLSAPAAHAGDRVPRSMLAHAGIPI